MTANSPFQYLLPWIGATIIAEAFAFGVIGAMVARLDLERVDGVLKAWQGMALLLSPQGLVFASSLDQWVGCIAEEPTPEKL